MGSNPTPDIPNQASFFFNKYPNRFSFNRPFTLAMMLSCSLADISVIRVLEFGGTSGIYLLCSNIMHKQTNTNPKKPGFRAFMTLLTNLILRVAYYR